MRIAFITNLCAHYRIETFETLAQYYDLDFFFFSAGDEWYWQKEHGVQAGDFNYEYLPGFHLGQTKIIPTLPWKLWSGDYDVYIKCINGRFALPITFLLARLKRKPFILWTGIWIRLQTLAHRVFYPLTRYIYTHADAIVVYGEHVKDFLIREGVSSKRVFVASHAVSNTVYKREVSEEEISALRGRIGIAEGKKVILYLGRLEEGKGLPWLVKAFASMRRDDVVLVIAGTGTEQSRLRRLVQEEGIAENVRFPGYIVPTETVLYYALASVCVLPSITTSNFKEPWGLVVNEAMNQGVPVITTDAVGAAAGGLVCDGINGYIVPERDSSALRQALQKVMDESELREKLGQNARRIVAGWSNERMVTGFRHAVEFVTMN